MAEAFAITAGIGSILKALLATGVYIKSAAGAEREAQEIADRVSATEGILKSLKASLKTVTRPHEFYNVWGESTNLVLNNMKATVQGLNGKFSSQRGVVTLSFWKKVTWPLDREDSRMLLEHLQAYTQMLSLAHIALLQGNMQAVQHSARAIDDIVTEVGTLPSSSVGRSIVRQSLLLERADQSEDSASQASVQMSEARGMASGSTVVTTWRRRIMPSIGRKDINLVRRNSPIPSSLAGSKRTPESRDTYRDTYEYSIELISVEFIRRGPPASLPQKIRRGTLTLTLPQDHSRILGFYKPYAQAEQYEWCLNPKNPGIDVITQEFVRFRWPITESQPGSAPSGEEILTLSFMNGSKNEFLEAINKLVKDAEHAQIMDMERIQPSHPQRFHVSQALSLQHHSHPPYTQQLIQSSHLQQPIHRKNRPSKPKKLTQSPYHRKLIALPNPPLLNTSTHPHPHRHIGPTPAEQTDQPGHTRPSIPQEPMPSTDPGQRSDPQIPDIFIEPPSPVTTIIELSNTPASETDIINPHIPATDTELPSEPITSAAEDTPASSTELSSLTGNPTTTLMPAKSRALAAKNPRSYILVSLFISFIAFLAVYQQTLRLPGVLQGPGALLLISE